MTWITLTLAIVFEVMGTTCMKLSEGFSRLLPSVLIFPFYGICFAFLTLTLKKMEVSVAYAVWSAVGTALISAIGIVWFRESLSLLKAVSLALIILGVLGLHFSHKTPSHPASYSGKTGSVMSAE